MRRLILTQEQINEIKKHKRRRKKDCSAMAQVGNKVNAGIMDGITAGGMFEEGAEPEANMYSVGPTKTDKNVSPYYHVNESIGSDFSLEESMRSLMEFMSNKIRIKPYPEIHLNEDEQDGLFIRTGYYLPDKKSITLFIAKRHDKDVLRSLAHELIHHNQNLTRPGIDWGNGGKLEDDDTLRKLEAEAFLKGNLLFREWTEEEKPKHEKVLNEGMSKISMFNMIYAKNQYGITEDFNSAGFILLNGELLDFGNYEEINRTSHAAFDVGGTKKREFMNDGNIRVNPQSPGIELSKEPTSEQYEKISEMIRFFLNRGHFFVDCVNEEGTNLWNKEYKNEETQNILTDIKAYFIDGKTPDKKGSDILMGHSLRDFLTEGNKKLIKNDKGKVVPKKCDKCGGKVVLQIHGEPVYLCKECGKYFGTMQFNLNENIETEILPKDVDLSSFNIKKNLNPKFWKDGHLDTRIRLKLIDIADAVMEYIDVDWFDPEDVIITGSLANYNWNDKYSDIDLHILIDFDDINEDKEHAKKYVDKALKAWKTEHNGITIFGFPVEVYVQDINEVHKSSGVYSIDKDKWIIKPDYEKLKSGKVNKGKIRKMVSHYATKIDNLCDIYNETNDDEYRIRKLGEKVEQLFKAMKEERKKGLSDSDSEINNGNIMYKALRRGGYLQKIIDLRHNIFDKMHSLLKENRGAFNSTAYMMIGIPGAGKSTWIKNNHPDLPVVSRDIIRGEIGICEPGQKYVGTNAEENEVTMHEYMKIAEYCEEGQDFIIDDTNTHKKYRKQMIDFLREKGAKVVFVHLDTPLDVCKERRKNDIPGNVMDRISRQFQPPEEDEYDEIIHV